MLPLIPAFVQQALTTGHPTGNLDAYAINVDLSGFTPLTNNLMAEGTQGAEELSQILNEIFEPLVAHIYDNGGFIPYFAGDAFTAIFPLPPDAASALHLLWVASRARTIMLEHEDGFGGYTIGMKVGLAYGPIKYGIVGEELKAFYFRGLAIDNAAHCQSLGQTDEILIDDRVMELLEKRNVAAELVAPQAYRVLGQSPGQKAAIPSLDLPEVEEGIAQQFLPASVIRERISGEFRKVISTFISFDGIRSHEDLDRFAGRILQRVLDFGGYFKEVDYGDKGALMVAFFGAPVSYENNLIRALEYAEAVRHEVEQLRQQGLELRYRLGMSQGTAFTGIVGGRERCQYACVGSQINLAARLMSSADWHETLVDAEVARTDAFRFQARGDFYYKGFKEALATYSLLGRRKQTGKPSYQGPIVGRKKETDQLVGAALQSLQDADPGLAFVYGEAGIGKSRFTEEVRTQIQNQLPSSWFFCPSDQILRKSFNPFVYFLNDYFEQAQEGETSINLARFESIYQQLLQQLQQDEQPDAQQAARELQRTESVLKALIGLPTDGSLWDRLDARGRYQNTIAAIGNIFAAESLLQPTVIELEDTHWIDDDSRVLLQELLRRLPDHAIFLICSSRYTDAGEAPHLVPDGLLSELDINPLRIDLKSLSEDAIREFAEQELGGPISSNCFDVLLRASNRNPFYLEQLLGYFHENELLLKDKGQWELRDGDIKLSESINSILTARIDRLSNLVRETVKAAAVIGREFDLPVLREVLRQQTGDDIDQLLIRDQVKKAEQGQIWSAVNELRYIFRHSLLREAVYSMQLNTRLQELHRQIAQVIERLYAGNIESHYVDLAFHYEQSGDEQKTVEYLQKAADYARANYQNQLALDLYDRLLAKTGKDTQQIDTLKIYLSRGQVLEIIGNWEAALDAYQNAQRIAKRSRDIILLGKTNNRLGHLLMLRGRYEEAMQYLQVAAGLFESIDDPLGIAKVYGNLGLLYFRRARYQQALDYFQRSLETGFTRVGTTSSAETVSYLGLTYMNRGEYQQGIGVIKEQIPLHQENNDSMGLANLHTNLGIIYFESGDDEAAQEHYQRGLQLAEELGNKQLQAIGTGCLGGVYERQGEYPKAMELFQRDLQLCQELGDWQGIAIAEGLIGELHSIMGEFEDAEQHLGRYLNISKDLGYQKGVAKAVNTLGDICFFQARYEESLAYYDQSIAIARKTNNVPVLGNSLMEKGAVLIAAEQLDELKATEEEALKIARDLGNPDLLFSTRLLSARAEVARGRIPEGLEIVQDLLSSLKLRPEQEASAYFERFRISNQDTEARDMARTLYEQLNQETPKYLYQKRLELLRQATNS